jgi:hypothetical protein
VARWTKKSLVFPFTRATDQIDFIDQLKRRLRLDFQIQANQRGLTVTLHGDADQVSLAVNQVKTIYQSFRGGDASKTPRGKPTV